jgi:hypothetical protein
MKSCIFVDRGIIASRQNYRSSAYRLAGNFFKKESAPLSTAGPMVFIG